MNDCFAAGRYITLKVTLSFFQMLLSVNPLDDCEGTEQLQTLEQNRYQRFVVCSDQHVTRLSQAPIAGKNEFLRLGTGLNFEKQGRLLRKNRHCPGGEMTEFVRSE